MIIIGVTGQPGSGKDTVADYIGTKGFRTISGGDVIREKMREIGLTTDRATMYEFIKKRREQYGNAYPSEEIIEKITADTVVAGFRNRDEVKFFRTKLGENYFLIAVEASLETRYERAKQRNRIGDDITLEQFRIEEQQERATDSGSHEVDAVVAIADVTIQNDGTLEELHEKVDEVLARITKKTREK